LHREQSVRKEKEGIMISLEATYNQAIGITRNIVEDIRFGRELYLYPVKICSIQICKYMDSDADILTLLNSVRNKNPYMYSHPVNVAFISVVIGKWLNMDCKDLVNLVRAGLLHDIGKAKIKDSLLNKTDTLTLEEMEKMKSHPVRGYKLLDSVNEFDANVLKGILFHHERMDGTGYPLGLKGDKIHMFGRIIAIADTFDAITASKTYCKKKSPLKAVEEIQANSFNQLDPYICQIFVNNMIEYYSGREIRLSNEQVGNIVYINPIEITKPVVLCENEYYDLSVEKDIEVVELL
jgi:HD-GYP domain-containing protein (c-di-GMP phosphodiesterase class II)